MNRFAITLGATAAVIGSLALATGAAKAAVVQKLQINQAVGAMCQGALPNYEGNFRKRPLAIANEGASSAFLTCGLTSQYDVSGGGVPFVQLIVTNRNAANTDMRCTLVDGYIDSTLGFADYFPLTINVVGLTDNAFTWDASTAGGSKAPVFGYPAISCNVPAKFEVNVEIHQFIEDIGA